MATKIYGIKACGTMKKAFNKLDALGVNYEFHDYKKQGIDSETVQTWVAELGIEKVLNKRGTTWRKLTDEQKLSSDADVNTAIELLVENTSMIKRPIVASTKGDEAILLCGFDEAAFEQAFA
ncbi:arsenate reductase [Psychrobacter sp. HD31]|uniref:arsenate reductase n=1 Tax=Psychrobacter sp. HD31 TaxID=3112003 RepID=UPI003DA54D6D